MDPDELWRRCCQGKRRYATETAAVAAFEKTHDRQAARGLNAYKCPFCNHWHIGHTKKRRKKKRKTM